jgi:hypothetical protein
MDINNVLGNRRKPDQPIELWSDDGVLIKEKVRVADKFNEYFTSIGGELAAGLEDVSDSGVFHDRNLSSIFLFETNCAEIGKIIDSLDVGKACGYDQVSARAMKAYKHELIPYLVHSINCSMNSGIYLDCLKLAKVRPLHKSGNKRHVGSYRPISVLSPVNKIFEKVIYHRLLTIINKHGLLSYFQFGFWESSTAAAANEIVDAILGALDGKTIVAGLFLNLQKAFDTIDHVILLKKLNIIIVRGVAAELLRNYLTNRLQTVCVNGECGSFLPVSIGLPQGSVLGPLLFLILINDIGSLPLRGSVRLFADDSEIFYPCVEVTKLVESVQADLTRLKRYFTANKLTLNVDKTLNADKIYFYAYCW